MNIYDNLDMCGHIHRYTNRTLAPISMVGAKRTIGVIVLMGRYLTG